MKKRKKLKVKKVAVPKGAVMRVKLPKGHVPVVQPHPELGHVDIVPVKPEPTWWEKLLG